MFFLIAPLLFIGFFSPACSVAADYENKKWKENLISLRDYDFVGEDQRLSSLLAERMGLLQAPLNLSELEAGDAVPEPAGPQPRVPGPFQPKSDYLHSNVRLPQVVTVGDTELINVTDWLLEGNASLLALAPGTGGAPAPRPGGASVPGYDRAPAPGNGKAPAPSHYARRVDGRRWGRKKYINPSHLDYNMKILDMMKQCIYTTQRKIMELDPLVQRYERDPRFRMAFIYHRLDEWLHDMRTLLHAMQTGPKYRRRFKRVIWYYENMLRLNIDITYSIEHLVFLHDHYTKHVDSVMSPEQRAEFAKMQREQRKFKKMQAMGLNPKMPKYDTQAVLLGL